MEYVGKRKGGEVGEEGRRGIVRRRKGVRRGRGEGGGAL